MGDREAMTRCQHRSDAGSVTHYRCKLPDCHHGPHIEEADDDVSAERLAAAGWERSTEGHAYELSGAYVQPSPALMKRIVARLALPMSRDDARALHELLFDDVV